MTENRGFWKSGVGSWNAVNKKLRRSEGEKMRRWEGENWGETGKRREGERVRSWEVEKLRS
jgi:hypothetical protein